MKINPEQASHLIYLIDLVKRTDGPVLELGIGFGSTPVLHELCRKRKLVSYENKKRFFDEWSNYAAPWHEMNFINAWEEADIERPWSVALVDQWPGMARRESLLRLRNWADYIVIHDTELKHNRFYHVREVIRTFKHHVMYKQFEPHTTVVSEKFPI